jgi:hypothetical protein
VKIAEICHRALVDGLEYETPVYLREGSGRRALIAAGEAAGGMGELFYYIDGKGRPVFPRGGLKPGSKWKALVLKGE